MTADDRAFIVLFKNKLRIPLEGTFPTPCLEPLLVLDLRLELLPLHLHETSFLFIFGFGCIVINLARAMSSTDLTATSAET